MVFIASQLYDLVIEGMRGSERNTRAGVNKDRKWLSQPIGGADSNLRFIYLEDFQ